MKIHIRNGLMSFVLITSLLGGWVLSAPPVRDKILDDVVLTFSDESTVLEVSLTFPLRYQSHFPQTEGTELRIRLKPVRVPSSDLDAVFRREAVTPRYGENAAVDEVIYEGDVAGGPYLTVRFTRIMHYEVIPAPDYRSINIVLQGIE